MRSITAWSTVVACVHRRVERGRAHRRKGIAHFLRRVGLSISAHVPPAHPVVLISCKRRVSGQDDQAALPPTPQKPSGVLGGGSRGQGLLKRRRLRRRAGPTKKLWDGSRGNPFRVILRRFLFPCGPTRSSAGDRPPGRCAAVPLLLSWLDPASAFFAARPRFVDVNLNGVIYLKPLVSNPALRRPRFDPLTRKAQRGATS